MWPPTRVSWPSTRSPARIQSRSTTTTSREPPTRTPRSRPSASPSSNSPLGALLLGEADGRDLGVRVGGSRLVVVVDRLWILAGDLVDGHDTLVGGHMRQHQPTDRVADGIDVRLRRAHPAVHLDEAALELDLRLLQAQVFGVWRPAGGDEQLIDLELSRRSAFRPNHERDAVIAHLDRSGVEAGLCHDPDAAPGEAALQGRAGILVFERDDARQILEQRHGP